MAKIRELYKTGWNTRDATVTILRNGTLRIRFNDEYGYPIGPVWETNKPRAGRFVRVQRETAGGWSGYQQISRHGGWRGTMAVWASGDLVEAATTLARDFRARLVADDACPEAMTA